MYDQTAHTVVVDSSYGSEENYRFMSENESYYGLIKSLEIFEQEWEYYDIKTLDIQY